MPRKDVIIEEDSRVWRRRPQQSRSTHTAASILLAAGELFATRGYHDTTAEDIVARAGVGIGSLYDYFPNKLAIALALLENTATAITRDCRCTLVNCAAEPIDLGLPRVIREIYEIYKRNHDVLIRLIDEVPELRAASDSYSLERLIHRASRVYLQMFEDTYGGANLAASHEFLCQMYTASIKQYLLEASPQLSEPEFLAHLSRAILAYFKTRE